MTNDRQRLNDYLEHMLEAVERIERYTQGLDQRAFFLDRLVQDAVIRNLEVIGEASRNIEKHYPQFAAQHPQLPLTSAYQMRNALSHGYFKVDFEIVWNTIRHDLPSLRRHIRAALGH